MNPSKAKRRANKHKHRDQAARRKLSVEKRPEQLELPVSMPEQVAAKPESQAKAAAQQKTKPAAKAAKAETISSSRFQVASGQTTRAGHKAPQRKPKSAQYATVRPAKTARPVADAASLSSPAWEQ